MKHIYQEGKNANAPTLLLLHGTGGNERDLISLGKMISTESAILSVRGNVSEGGMPRFFRRIAEGIFDEEDLLFRTEELNHFIDESAKNYQFNRNNVIAVGYSNGANIAGSLLFHYKDSLKGAILFHPMVPRRGISLPDLTNTPIFIGAGKNDPLCPPEESNELAQLLINADAQVELFWENTGHQLTLGEVKQAAKWFEKNFIEK